MLTRNRILLFLAVGLCVVGWFRYLNWDKATGLRTMPVTDALGQELNLAPAEFDLGTVVDGDFAYQIRSEKTEGQAPDKRKTHLVRYSLQSLQGVSLGILPEHWQTVGFASGKKGQLLLVYKGEDELWAAIIGSDTTTVVPTGAYTGNDLAMLTWADEKLQFATERSYHTEVVSVDEQGHVDSRSLNSLDAYHRALPEKIDHPSPPYPLFQEGAWWMYFQDGNAISEDGKVRHVPSLGDPNDGDLSVLGLVDRDAGSWRLRPDLTIEQNPASPKHENASSDTVKGYQIVHGHLTSKRVWALQGEKLGKRSTMLGLVQEYVNAGDLHPVDGKYVHIRFPTEEDLDDDSPVFRFLVSWFGKAPKASFILNENSGSAQFFIATERANEILFVGLLGEYLALNRQSLKRIDPLPWQEQMRLTAETKFFGLQAELLYILLGGAPVLLLFALAGRVAESRKRRVPLRVEAKTADLASSVASLSKSEKFLSMALVTYLFIGFPTLVHIWPLMP